MSVQTDPLPPVPEHTPPLKEDETTRLFGRYFNQVWTRWFVSLRDKVNVISESLVSLGDVSGSGLVTKNGASWGTTGTGNLVQGSNVTLTGTLTDRLVGTGNVTVSASGGGGGSSFYSKIMALVPLAYYRLNETSGTTINDSSGNGYNGTLIGTGYTLGVAGMVPGSTDTCITFNGTDGYINLGQPAAMNFGSTQEFSVIVLLNYNTFNPTNGASVSKAMDTDRLAHIDTATNCLFWRSGGSSINPTALGAFSSPSIQFLNAPTLVVLVRRYINTTLYLEAWCGGNFIGLISTVHNAATGIDWLIGARRSTNNSTTGNYINARLQHVAVFDYALSQGAIKSLIPVDF